MTTEMAMAQVTCAGRCLLACLHGPSFSDIG